MAEHVELVVLIPVARRDDVVDTVDSVLTFAGPSTAVIVLDDTRGGGADMNTLRRSSRRVTIVPAIAGAPGVFGSLWRKVAAGYRFALKRYTFDMLLRMDADSLLLGPGLADCARERFAEDASIGMLGSYRVGPDGALRDFSVTARTLSGELGWMGARHPRLRRTLRALLHEADKHGYERGEHALGAAYLHRGHTIRHIAARGWLDIPSLGASRLCDDHLMALITRAAGFRIADFGGPGDPMALRWKGLPAAPEELIARGALVTHSVRSFADLDEAAIRAYFASKRRSGAEALSTI